MPSWKKVVISGSQAELAAVSASIALRVGTNQQITSTQSTTSLSGSFSGSFTGTLTGTASTASFVNQLNQNVVITGSLSVTQNITGSRMYLSSSNGTASGSTLIVYGSGSAQPVFSVQGSQGELCSVTDSLSGSLFSVNDVTGLPILEVFSDNTTLIGSYLDPMLITTARVIQTTAASFTVYSLPTASYDTAFFEYSVKSGSNARAGTIMAIQSGSIVEFTDVKTNSIGNTSAISLGAFISGSRLALTGSCSTANWTIKTIVRGL